MIMRLHNALDYHCLYDGNGAYTYIVLGGAWLYTNWGGPGSVSGSYPPAAGLFDNLHTNNYTDYYDHGSQ